MGLLGLLIAVVVLILIFVFTYFSNSPSSLNPEKSEKIQNEAQEVMDSTTEKAKQDQEQIKNIGQP